MNRKLFLILIISIAATWYGCEQKKQSNIHIAVSMDKPDTHYYHVEIICGGLKGKIVDFKMPAWTPGYYLILDFARNVKGFVARNEQGDSLKWEKITKNTWRVNKGNAKTVIVQYDVFAFRQSVAEPYLDNGRGFISPTGVFMFIDGLIKHDVTVTVNPYKEWTKINTGLEPAKWIKNTFYAKDFDVLYDSPILIGTQVISTFNINNIPYTLAFEDRPSVDTVPYFEDLKKIIIQGSGVIGDIPYKHYTFLIMGPGRGGLEHSNSMAVFSNPGYALSDSTGYKRWLAFIAHEFFHLYNVKAIRPIALGPFDYDKENYTNMLWVSEGITVYYEYIILNRAGILNRQQALDMISRDIASFENSHGRCEQSPNRSSFDAWINFFNRDNNALNSTISYYDAGCVLGLLLDLKIRNESRNKKSLDDVMRQLYFSFYKELNRGFTDEEFRKECEKAAGCFLQEIFDYASHTSPYDYKKYLGYAGIDIDLESGKVNENYYGIDYKEQDGEIVITFVEQNSPAWNSGASVQDKILKVNGFKATMDGLKKLTGTGTAGFPVRLEVSRRTGIKTIEFTPVIRIERDFKMIPMKDMNPLQAEIFKSWLNK